MALCAHVILRTELGVAGTGFRPFRTHADHSLHTRQVERRKDTARGALLCAKADV